ncbi:MAG: hypothetical protein SangKO_021300 [Sandaracinaceae bacterium]
MEVKLLRDVVDAHRIQLIDGVLAAPDSALHPEFVVRLDLVKQLDWPLLGHVIDLGVVIFAEEDQVGVSVPVSPFEETLAAR